MATNSGKLVQFFSFVRWINIALQKSWGGWGLKDLPTFVKVFLEKVRWRLLSIEILWTAKVIRKYIFPFSLQMDLKAV